MTPQPEPHRLFAIVAFLVAAIAVPAAAAGQTQTLSELQVMRDTAAESGDFVGTAVAISGNGNTVAVGAPRSGSTVYWAADEGAVYVFERNTTTGAWGLQARLTLETLGVYSPVVADHFGTALAISEDGNTLVIGASHEVTGPDTPGNVYVIGRTGSTWQYVQSLAGSGSIWFGTSVALRGSTIVVGDPNGGSGGMLSAGAAFVYRQTAGRWNMTVKLNGADEQTEDEFGAAVAIDEDENTILVGAPGESEPDNGCRNGSPAFGCRRGAAYVFEYNPSTAQWGQTAKLNASDWKGWLEFGYAVSISGNYAVVGAPGDHSLNPQSGGAAYVFQGSAWTQTAMLVPSTSESLDEFGASVAIWGSNIVVGAPRANYACPINPNADCDSGTALLFQRSGSVWTELRRLVARDATSGRYLGASVSLIGTNIAVGAPTPNTGAVGSEWSGRAYVHSLGGGPDLVETFVTDPPSTGMLGDTFLVTDTAQNRGSVAAASATTTRYFLSPDGRKHGMDGFLGMSRSVGALAPGATATGSPASLLRVPDTRAGSYVLLACGDDTYINVETDESNNCIASSGAMLIAGPDLAVTTMSNPPASATLSSTFTMFDIVLNDGSIAPPSTSVVRYFLSADQVRSASDVAFTTTRAIGLLSPHASSSASTTLTIPPVPGGAFFVLACADGQGAIPETNEANNCRASTTTVLVSAPDLRETAVSNPPAAAVIGSFLTISDTVTNQGNGAAGSFVIRYYLSFDQNKESWDTLLGSRTVTSLAAGASSTASVTVQIPSMSSQTYQVLACADDLASIAESNELNNCRASATGMVVTGPDLIVTSLTDPPNIGFHGDRFMVMDMIQNQGDAAASMSPAVWYYLSPDRSRGGTDYLLGGRVAPPVAAGAVSAGGQLVTIPQNVPDGSYFLLACADAVGVITEQNEANNCRASANPISVFTIRF